MRISPDAMDALMNYDWPGNVRELENAIERAVVLNRSSEIAPRDLPLSTSESPRAQTLADVEKDHIARMLEEMQWNISRTAERLQIDRVTLYNKIEKYGLKRPK
jgi:DNA-binding NtrC family response regulator